VSTINTQRIFQDLGYPLLTRERTDKLDLLQHLTANLARTVVICGPEGIGKSRLLQHYQDAFTDDSLLCVLKGDSQFGMEHIKEQVINVIAQKIPQFQGKPLPEILEKLTKRDSFALLLIDDAGQLAPGLMGELISYAGQYPALRIVFALTHSELYLKNGTDTAVEDCYQIEIPALTELQCADFLEYLSTLPNPRIDFNAINETFVAELYRETHGIPGKILTKLPRPLSKKKLDYSAPILVAAVISLILIALIVQWWSSRPRPAATVASAAKLQEMTDRQPESVKPVSPVAQYAPVTSPAPSVASPAITAGSTGVAVQQATAGGQPQPAVAATQTNTAQLTPAQTQVQLAAAPSSQSPAVNMQNLDEGGQWLMSQPAETITLQLMALPDPQAIINVMQSHPELGSSLRMLKTYSKRGKERYILLYGSFANAEQANAEAKNLPKDLRKTWTRQITAIQAELQSAPRQPDKAATAPPAPLIKQVQ